MMRIRPAKGFTLLEVATVAAVASVVFLILLRWLSTLGNVSGSLANSATPARNAAYVQARLAADIDAATVCDPVAGTPLRALDASTLELYVAGDDASGKPTVNLVRWSAADGLLTRTSWQMDQGSSGSGSCLPPKGTVNTGAVIASDAYTGGAAWMFTPMSNGQVITTTSSSTSTGASTGTPSECATGSNGMPTVARGSAGDGCYAGQIQLYLVLLAGGQDVSDSSKWTDAASPTRIKRVYTLPGASGALS